ncbi:RNA-binding protein [Streptomyces sp. Amel2xC10]|uniref:RNA-binding protein n=1 Tax=Streptomyces sp. Amel2xC10 TaxID=1305826 RepID=UPI000A0831AA|nr:RNA-binding protein [Streptomyces sp. Amel2xC10]SME91318.1 small subunit ribosomal protein S1 [Streptomyces sp. Amel2xC10]
MHLPHVYRVTKYDPADRDEHGHYTGTESTASDHGAVEAAYLRAVEAFAAETGVDRLAVREPQVPSLAHFGGEPALPGFGLDALFPDGLTSLHDGAEVPLGTGLEMVRLMLRDAGAWCRLEVPDVFAVHVGRDQYLYVGSDRPCEEAVARTAALGLFAERCEASPYAVEEEEDGHVQVPADDEFWARVHRVVAGGEAGLLEETFVAGAERWHRLTPETVDAVRAGLVPRACLALWPDLSTDVTAVLAGLPADGLVEGVWQEPDGRIRNAVVDESGFAELAVRMSAATAATLLSVYADERVPLLTAVLPDGDGVVRARWRS